MVEFSARLQLEDMEVKITRWTEYRSEGGIVTDTSPRRCVFFHMDGFYLVFREKDGVITKYYTRDGYDDYCHPSACSFDHGLIMQTRPLIEGHASMISTLMSVESEDAARELLEDGTPIRVLIHLFTTGVQWVCRCDLDDEDYITEPIEAITRVTRQMTGTPMFSTTRR